jgi:hypothetical protein
MKHIIDMASDDMMYVPGYMKIFSGIELILRLLSQQFERL